MSQCADTIKRVSMELGGNAPLIVFDSADVKLAVRATIGTKFRNTGQTCISPNRCILSACLLTCTLLLLLLLLFTIQWGLKLVRSSDVLSAMFSPSLYYSCRACGTSPICPPQTRFSSHSLPARLLVQSDIHDAFVEELSRAVSQLTVGEPFQDGVQQGPLINEPAVEKVCLAVEDVPVLPPILNPSSVARWSDMSPMQCQRVERSYWAVVGVAS